MPNKQAYRIIELTKGAVARVDESDYERIAAHEWYLNSAGYAVRDSWGIRRANRKTLLMHREILNPRDGLIVDHINRVKLDNRRANLRECTYAQNGANRLFSRAGLRGVNPRGRRFEAAINVSGTYHYIGRFGTAVEAAHAYDDAARKFFGEFATTNYGEVVNA